MSEIAFNKTVVLIISLVVLITLIVYFYNLYHPYKKSSEGFFKYTNESINEISLRMECVNKKLFDIEKVIRNSLDKQCSSFESVVCNEIFIENGIPYYNCTAYCYRDNTKLMCPVKYNCKEDKAQINGYCIKITWWGGNLLQ